MEDDVRRSREAGFSKHLTKPVSLPALEAAIRQTVRGGVRETVNPAWERESPKGRWLRYGLAVAAVGLTFLIKLPLDQAVGRGAPFQLFSLAIIFSAGFGGLGPGLLATALSTVIGWFWVVPVAPSAGAAVLRTVIFLLQGTGISAIGHFLERTRRRAEEAYASLSADMAERERLDRELERANRRAVDILESVNDAFFSLDREWRFTYANRVFTRFVGQRAEDLIGRVFWEVYPQMTVRPTRRATGEPSASRCRSASRRRGTSPAGGTRSMLIPPKPACPSFPPISTNTGRRERTWSRRAPRPKRPTA